ncbi:MAG TPA: hypothetical protein VMF65_15160 [Acidimicrobiales bacterium]|nr:hypothetical protein [Acidimicrobiales bacterium]
MAIQDPGYEYDPRYEVAWPLIEDDSGPGLDDTPDRPWPVSRENLESLLRFAGLLAGAETAAIALCRGEGLIIEMTDPPTPWLTAGTFVRAQPPSSTDEDWSIRSLLTGRMRWCWCKPPAGFDSAALVRGPWLVGARRLLLVANRRGRLSEVSLGLAASYLAQAWWPAPEPTTYASNGSPGADGADEAPAEDAEDADEAPEAAPAPALGPEVGL